MLGTRNLFDRIAFSVLLCVLEVMEEKGVWRLQGAVIILPLVQLESAIAEQPGQC